MKLNVAVPTRRMPVYTHEGAPAVAVSPALALRRSVMACMLWENNFYESGETIATRIENLVAAVEPMVAVEVALAARIDMKLRHAPLLVARAMARLPNHKRYVSHLLEAIIQRPDELTEFLAIYWKEKRQPLSAQVKKGLAKAFAKFDEYALAKYNRDGPVKLRDVLFLSHSKPSDAPPRKWTKTERKLAEGKVVALSPRECLNLRVVGNALATPDTWEVALSSGADKKETFERLITERKLGALALLRNLRGMKEAGVSKEFVAAALASADVSRVLPFRFIAAARYVPAWEDIIEPAMLRCTLPLRKLPGRTVLLIDVSGSMDAQVSGKSDLMRVDAACGLAILLREMAPDLGIFTFSDYTVEVPLRRGFALRDAVVTSQPHHGTMMGSAVRSMNAKPYNRLITITDEQSHDAVPPPNGLGYVINVATNQHGVGYGQWTHIDGWSEAIIDYIQTLEQDAGLIPPQANGGDMGKESE